MRAGPDECNGGAPGGDALLTDLYQLSMLEAYGAAGMEGTASFEFFVRCLPACRSFLMAAGLEQVLDMLEGFRFTEGDLEFLAASGHFSRRLIDQLATLRFTGDVDAMPEGTVFFADEPILRVTAPLPQAQLVETRIINLLHLETVVASKAARMVLAAGGRQLIDFGFRRAHGAEAGVLAARASYLAGFGGTATLEAHRRFGVPVFGTMAHSFIQAHDDESRAFEHFARVRPEGLVLLIDTYDTIEGARKVAELAPRLDAEGIRVRGVRIDSGDLGTDARQVRAILDKAGLGPISIFASGGLDEEQIAGHVRAGDPIDGYGIGTSLVVSSDAPALDCAYKLQEYEGVPRRKLSRGKVTWPGRKQVWRCHDGCGRMVGDTLSTMEDTQRGEPLLRPAMRDGRRLESPSLEVSRRHAAGQLDALPTPLRALEKGDYSVMVGAALRRLAADCDRRLAERVWRS